MSIATVTSRALIGIHAPEVTVEVHVSSGLPRVVIVGLPEKVVKESKERVRSALINNHFDFPRGRVTINLGPADLPKEGGCFDLPIALGILVASRQLPPSVLDQYEVAGELSLSGEVRPAQGLLAFALAARKKSPDRPLIIPAKNAEEAALVRGVTILPAQHLLEVCAHLKGDKSITPYPPRTLKHENEINAEHDLSQVYEQKQARRALEISAAGRHSLLLSGPPGTGKTLLAHCLSGLLPALTEDEALEVAAISSVSHQGFDANDWQKVPFRSPHHSASSPALVGGSNPPQPGEVSLAHHGVLFLDELPEFNRHVLEALREPLESGKITISRAGHQVLFPARCQFIAAMNPCPCGYFGDTQHECRCTPQQIHHYRNKASGPLLDRVDMHLTVPRSARALDPSKSTPEDSKKVRARVLKARDRQIHRAKKANAHLNTADLKEHCSLENEEQNLLGQAIQQFGLSHRGHQRILRVARTIADLDESKKVTAVHLKEAICYRIPTSKTPF